MGLQTNTGIPNSGRDMGKPGVDTSRSNSEASGNQAKDIIATKTTNLKKASSGAASESATTRAQAKERRDEMGFPCWVVQEAGKNM